MTMCVGGGINSIMVREILIYGYTYGLAAATAAKLLQSCLTVYDPIDSSPPGSRILRIL